MAPNCSKDNEDARRRKKQNAKQRIEKLRKAGRETKKNKDHDAAGINDDWPVGRGVFISDDRDFFVFVNFEDHLKLVVLESLFDDI